MTTLVEVKDIDRTFYAERLQDWLPEQIIDIHTHVWRKRDFMEGESREGQENTVSWPQRVAADNPVEDLLETYRLMLPGKQVTPLIFPTVPQADNVDVQNRYVAECSRQAKVPALIWSLPEWSAEEFEERVRSGGFLGIKSYLTCAPDYIPAKEVRIYDFFPRHQLEVCDRNRWIVMLHIPRDGRLRDPVNLAQMIEIDRDFPNARVVIAHVGRAYVDADMEGAFEALSVTKNIVFDFSANTNANVFEALLRCVGPQRVCFGTDMPILRMRMKRIEQDGHYVNLVPKGLYGDVSGDKNMGELEGEEAEALTFFLYEELSAFRTAAERVGLSRADIEDVFYNNAARLLERPRDRQVPTGIDPPSRFEATAGRQASTGFDQRSEDITMTKREVVKTALEGKRPPYVPWSFGFTSEAREKLVQHFGTDELQPVLQNHFLDLGDAIGFFEDLGNDQFRDGFGVVWDRSVDKDIGNVVNPQLAEPTLAGYEFPDPLADRFFADIPEQIEAHGDRFRIFSIGFSLYERAWTLRGMENLMMDFIEHPEFVHELLGAIADYNVAQVKKALTYDIDAVYFGDDWGQQQGLQMGPQMWREFIRPHLERMYRVVRDAGKCVLIHSCGDVDELFDDLIDIGLNCFNPFQPEVMDVPALMKEYRGRLSFHGGLSTQKTLPYGAVEDVRNETRKLIELGAEGNYIFAPAHAVEGDVPLENMLAFIDEVQSQPGEHRGPGHRRSGLCVAGAAGGNDRHQ